MLLDTSLLSRARQEPAALDELIMAIRPVVEHQLLRYPVSDEDRRDLLQSTLLRVVRRLGTFRGDSSFSTWLFRVTANEALMLMRAQRRHRARLVDGVDVEDLGAASTKPPVEEAGERSARLERDTVLRDALAELPDDYRTLVLAHYHDDLGLQEIADRLCTTESAVRSRLHRARSRLREILKQMNLTPSGLSPTQTGAPA